MSPAPIIKSTSEARLIVEKWQSAGLSIAFTNGCFDIIHKGHIDYLSECAIQCDRLVVGLNSDISIQKIKGPNRPIQDEESRATILAAVRGIDLIILFDEKTPIGLIESLNPTAIIKGGDYTEEEMIGRDHIIKNGGSCVIIPFTEGHSTSMIIEKIKNQLLE